MFCLPISNNRMKCLSFERSGTGIFFITDTGQIPTSFRTAVKRKDVKIIKNAIVKRTVCLLTLVCLLTALSVHAHSASAFEKSIADFPESYRVLLREVHERHPNWVFHPMQTGLSFYDAVATENRGNNSLVPASNNYSYIFKSHAAGDYDAASDSYIRKDGGFCNANRYAVSYFMDPRNHLNDAAIFQFEDLSFDSSFTTQAVDVVLDGTFMYKTKVTYYTADGTQKTSKETYAEMIYDAGKAYNINPCFLASKIRNEIGASPSGSVTGRNSTYPGIYNFYNIGASDGAGAITRGLAWAANTTSGTYHRPWTTPKKSIVGGAEFFAATYIAKGQFTSYLQRFNVNPDSSYATYQHQYMTNVSGAAEQSYGSYYTYLSNGLLDNAFIFSIPVYENMTGENDNSGTLTLQDAKSQKAEVALSFNINVRTGPSQNYDKLDLTLAPGTKVTVLDTTFTDSIYYDSILRYPNWYQIRFKQNGTTYKGYVPCGFMRVTTSVGVKRGAYTPKASGSKDLQYRFVSITPDTVSVVNETQLNFTAAGRATVLAYDSTGRFAILNYTVSDSGAAQPTTKPTTTNPTTTTAPHLTTHPVTLDPVQKLWQSSGTADSVTVQWEAVPGATGYRVYRFDTASHSFQPLQDAKQTSFSISALQPGESVLIKIKAFQEKNGKTYWSDASPALGAVTTPDAPAGLKQTGSASDAVTLTWKAVNGASGYQLYQYDSTAGSYKKITSSAQTTCTVTALSPDTAYRFTVRAVYQLTDKALESADSNPAAAHTGPAKVSGLHQKSTTTAGYKLSWNAVDHAAGYKVFRIDPQTTKLTLVMKTAKTTVKIKNQAPSTLTLYAVKAFSKTDGGTYYGTNSDECLAASAPEQTTGCKQYAASDNSAGIKWTAVPNASGYAIYRYTGESWKKLKTTEKTKAVIRSLPSDSTMKFRVRAFIRVNGQVIWGKSSVAFKVQTDK